LKKLPEVLAQEVLIDYNVMIDWVSVTRKR